MRRAKVVTDSIDVSSPALDLWTAIADPTQMGRWSPENTGAVTAAARPLEVGESFVGSNRRGPFRWHTRCVVTASAPGERFAFVVKVIGRARPIIRSRIASWEYTFAPVDGGTRVTETWTDDRRWPDRVAALVDPRLTGGELFADFQRRNIARTLAALKADFEAGAHETG